VGGGRCPVFVLKTPRSIFLCTVTPYTPPLLLTAQAGPEHPERLMTDRTSYISYLESQLERVTSACLTVQSFDERLEGVNSSLRLLEDKVPLAPHALASTLHVDHCLKESPC
jgi:hypothetical protein